MHISLPFRSAPSAEFVYQHLDGLQHVWKRIFEHVMDRGDTYKREAFNGMHDEGRIIDPEIYADLRVSHDTYARPLFYYEANKLRINYALLD